MKIRLHAYAIMILSIIVGNILFSDIGASPVDQSPNDNKKQEKNEERPSVIDKPTTKLSSKAQQANDAQTQEFIDRARKLMLSKNKQLNLYGQVVDQYNKPVAGAKIVYSIEYYDGVVRGDYGSVIENYTVHSDNEGRFALLNQFGVRMVIRTIKKAGYEFTTIPDNNSHIVLNYGILKGSHIPKKIAEDTPVVFKGWKIGNIPTKYFQESYVRYGFDAGEIYTIDFLNRGAKHKGQVEGDLRVFFERSGDMVRDKPSWSVRLEAVNGGLIETSDVYNYLAPEDGYSASWEYGHSHDDSDYTSIKQITLYLKSRNGQVHTRLNLEINPFYNTRPVIVTDYFANPTGSRSLYSKRR
jgi:hypothetical protein